MTNITAIDFETANSSPASVCSVGISTMEEGIVEERYYTLIRPEDNVCQFNYWNMKIHGIHPEDVIDAPCFSQVLMEMTPYLESGIVCAHNARFDMGCLRASCANTNQPLPSIRWFDTVQLAQHVWPQLPHHRLDDMCSYLGVELNHHNAASDAYGCLMIAANAMELSGIYDIEALLKHYQVRINTLSR